MGALRSLWRASAWLMAVVCLLLSFTPSALAATREVGIRDESLPTEFRTFFLDPVSGTNVTTIVAGDGVRWRWGNPPLTTTIDFHSTKSGRCVPGDCPGPFGAIWNSETTTPGTFTQGPGTFGTAFTTGTATPLTAPFTVAGTYDYHCGFHGQTMPGTIIVLPAALDHFDVTGAPVVPVTAGQAFTVTVAARDQFNNLKTNYTGTVMFSVTNPHPSGGEVPANYTFVGGDQGDRAFTFTLKTAGSRTITIQDGAVQKQFTVTVNPTVANQLVLSNTPVSANAGTAFSVTVTARDQFNNTATGYGGTVHFTSSDSGATLPADNTLISGTRNFNVTLVAPGTRTLTVTDTVNGALTDSASIAVAVACSITFSNPATITINDVAAGSPYPSSINVAGLNQNNNGMSVTLSGINHQFGVDIDVLLVGPAGQKMVILSDSGGNAVVSDATITLEDTAASLLPSALTGAPLVSGTFKPTNHSIAVDTFPAPAPAGPYADAAPTGAATFASTFTGSPNGTWSLYVADNIGGGAGNITGGWSLTFAPPANTFCNQNAIVLPTLSTSAPYPSQLTVANVDGTVRNVSLRLDRVTKAYPVDLDLLLVGPSGSNQRKMIMLSDVGGSAFPPGTNSAVVSLADSGGPVPGLLASGIFRPANLTLGDTFPAPAPAGPYSDPAAGTTIASAFGGINPNGTWSLYIVDDEIHPPVPPFFIAEPTGAISGGWALTFDVIFNTTTTMSSTINPSVVGDIAIINTNVTSSGPGTPTGTVSYTLNGAPFGSAALGTDGGAAFGFQPIAGTYNLTATYSGDANFHPSTSNTLIQVVNPGPTTTAVVSSPNPSTFGQSVTFTATVSESTPYAPTGTVTFKDGAATIGTGTVNAGVATFSTASLLPGAHSITAVYNGDSNFVASTSPALTQTVNKANTTTAVVSGTNPSTFGGSVIFTATVSDSTTSTPTGTVTFKDGATTIGSGTLNASAVATLNIASLTGGSHSITAVYNGDGNFNTSTSPAITQNVNKATPTASVISFQNPSVFTQDVPFRADVLGTGVTPTGTVTFKDGVTNLTTITVQPDGTALFNTAALAGGNHNITVVYNGDGNYNTATSPILVQQVAAADSSTALVSSLNPSTFSQNVTFTATVTSSATPTGTVTFKDGAATLGTSPLSGGGVATLLTSALSSGSHSITAVYNGNSNFLTSTSAPLTQTVNQASTTSTVISSSNPSTFGGSVTFTATVNDTVPGNASGTVNFRDGAATIGTGTLNGATPPQATLTTASLTGGPHSITAVYVGSSNFTTSTSSAVTQTVNKANSTTALNSSDTTTVFGESVTFTATVTAPGGTPTGTVTFKDGAGTLGTSALVSGVATFNISTLSFGSHNITAEYGGSGNLNTSTSPQVVQNVGQSATNIVITAGKATSGFREAVTFTVTVSSTTSGTPTGSVTLFDGATIVGSGSLSGGQAQFTVTRMTIGRHEITAQYGGDLNFPLNGSSPTLIHYRSPRPR